MGPVTTLLGQLAAGDKSALSRLVPHIYHELRSLASGYIRREEPGHTLPPTALVHEAYVRLVGRECTDYKSRGHFIAVAANAMRQILVDHARTHAAAKRGGGQRPLSINETIDSAHEDPPAFIALNDALTAFEQHDPHNARLVEMHYFGGLTAEEISDVTGIAPHEVRRELRVARAWLRREIR